MDSASCDSCSQKYKEKQETEDELELIKQQLTIIMKEVFTIINKTQSAYYQKQQFRSQTEDKHYSQHINEEHLDSETINSLRQELAIYINNVNILKQSFANFNIQDDILQFLNDFPQTALSILEGRNSSNVQNRSLQSLIDDRVQINLVISNQQVRNQTQIDLLLKQIQAQKQSLITLQLEIEQQLSDQSQLNSVNDVKARQDEFLDVKQQNEAILEQIKQLAASNNALDSNIDLVYQQLQRLTSNEKVQILVKSIHQ
eukprot:EST43623.1 Hypothetical protein SS50377_16666 [Spironucleus salmonicida]